MSYLILTRSPGDDQGTPGTLIGPGLALVTLELPWRDNQPNISCIPAGKYICKPTISPKFGPCIGVQDVPGRANILIHAGNWAGDKSKGFITDSQGCILVGLASGTLSHQRAVTSSRDALGRLLFWAKGAEFDLEITS
ncbi:MAG: DUF5675 family protein [Desulfovibrionaceae bacterium]|nr:DUF5675 family protein [Desulfovibrionaceae bacterium]